MTRETVATGLGKPPHRRLRKIEILEQPMIVCKPPHRRLRNVTVTENPPPVSKPPHRRLRKR